MIFIFLNFGALDSKFFHKNFLEDRDLVREQKIYPKTDQFCSKALLAYIQFLLFQTVSSEHS